MKKLFIVLAFLFCLILPAKADVMPYYVNNLDTSTIGVYQAEKNIKIYQEPNVNSKLLLEINWDAKGYSCADVSASNLFVVFLPQKELAFLPVVDENDNEDWVKIVYNQKGSKYGWLKKDDEFKFMSWRSFFNIYGRKYGLYYMKDAPEESKIIYGNNADDAKSIGKMMLPQNVQLTSVKGNWLLIIAFDVDHTQKIGWIKWRNISGEIYLFPNIK